MTTTNYIKTALLLGALTGLILVCGAWLGGRTGMLLALGLSQNGIFPGGCDRHGGRLGGSPGLGGRVAGDPQLNDPKQLGAGNSL